MRTYEKNVEPFISSFYMVTVPEEKILKIQKFVSEVVKEKSTEASYQKDKNSKAKRFYTGTLGEAAIEELLGVDIIDWSMGDSAAFNDADLRTIGLNVGVKTVEYGSFPVIHKKAKRPEIVAIKVSDNAVIVCGLAYKNTLNHNQDIELLKSPALRNKNTKTGFYGFDRLIPFTNLKSLKLLLAIEKKHSFI